MPNCVVKGCIKQTSTHKKKDGITFHTFPNRDLKMKKKWIDIVRKSRKELSWQPTSRSVVCSEHFKIDDLYYTNKGFRRVVKTGYPKVLPNITEGLDTDLSQPPNIKEDPDALDISNDLNLSQPSTSCDVQPVKSEPSILDTLRKHKDISNDLNLSQPSTSCDVQPVKSEPSILDTLRKHKDISNDLNLSQPSTSCDVQPVKLEPSILDTLRKHKLRKRVLLLEAERKKNKRKIKTLNQKVRRLHTRNKSLKGILDKFILSAVVNQDNNRFPLCLVPDTAEDLKALLDRYRHI